MINNFVELKGEKYMSIQLLDKTRKINHFLSQNESERIDVQQFSCVLSDILKSNCIVVDAKGTILGVSNLENIPVIEHLLNDTVGEKIDSDLNERLLGILSTKENVNLMILGFEGDTISEYQGLVLPIHIAGKRLGTVFLYTSSTSYQLDDIILGEYAMAVLGLELSHVAQEESEMENRKIEVVKSAIHTLSLSELEAIKHIFEELENREGILVASKIADRAGITRSVIVNAVRKFESAGVIEARSAGMRGTYIKVVNDFIYEELENLKNK